MKNKIKKIITTTLVSAVSLTVVGCGSNNNKLAKNIDKSMENFVSSINNLDYVETQNIKSTYAKSPSSSKNIGKIVETSTNEDTKFKIKTSGNHIQFLNNNISEAEVENTIKVPSERTDNFNLFILSSTPFVTLTSEDNNSLNLNVKFSTNQITETSDEIESKINSLILKRSILMIYVNEIYNGNVNLSSENKLAINAYVNVIKENTSFLNGNRGMVKNQLSLASDLASSEQNENLINYYIIKSSEALETRANKLDSTISAIDSIITIIESNLTTSSNYYQTNLSGTYDNLVNQTNNIQPIEEISESSSNQEIAGKIACTLDFCNLNKTTESTNKISSVSPSTENTLKTNTINERKINQETSPTTPIQNTNNINNQSLNDRNTNTNTNNQLQNNSNTLNNTNNLNESNSIQNEQHNQSSETNHNINKVRRLPNSVRYRRNQNSNNINSRIDSKNNNLNENNNIKNLDSRNNLMQNTKTLRAERTPENLNNEEYTTTSSSFNEPQATRVPYKSTINHFEK